MRNRKAAQPGYRPFIRCLLIIAALLASYAALQILLVSGPVQATNAPAHFSPNEDWSRAA